MSDGIKAATPTTLRGIAREWDASAETCDRNSWPILAARDRGIALALRQAADILETGGAGVVR